MSSQKLNRRLSAIDAGFLYFEKTETPLHNGSVSVFEGEIPFEDFIRMIDAKIHLIPRYQQIVKFDPYNLGHPTWEFDPNFDVRKHIHKIQIEAPGGEEQLIELSSKILSPIMDRNKPLWDIFLVYGLKGENSAMLARVHHCMIDGASGMDLIKILLDISPKFEIPPKPEIPPPAAPKLDPTRQFFDSLLGGLEEGMKSWMQFQTGLLNLTRALSEEPAREAARKIDDDILPSLFAPASSLPFNRQTSAERKFVWATFPFAEVRAIRGALGGTVNDAALTMLSGAVSKYVENLGQTIENRSVRFMVPVSLRQEEQRDTLGNIVSALPVEVPLDTPNAAERFRLINEKTKAMKAGRVAEGINLFTALMGMMPAPLQALTGALGATPRPTFNMVATNVPGPQVPLYAMGKKMTAYYPYVPVGFAAGCSCGILSYDQKISFGLNSDTEAMPDVERLRDFLIESYAELLAAAGIEKSAPLAKKQTTRTSDAAIIEKAKASGNKGNGKTRRTAKTTESAQPRPKKKLAKKAANKRQ